MDYIAMYENGKEHKDLCSLKKKHPILKATSDFYFLFIHLGTNYDNIYGFPFYTEKTDKESRRIYIKIYIY